MPRVDQGILSNFPHMNIIKNIKSQGRYSPPPTVACCVVVRSGYLKLKVAILTNCIKMATYVT